MPFAAAGAVSEDCIGMVFDCCCYGCLHCGWWGFLVALFFFFLLAYACKDGWIL